MSSQQHHTKSSSHPKTSNDRVQAVGSHPQAAAPRKPWFPSLMVKLDKWALLVFFVCVWLWASLYYGDVFVMAREFSFWTSDDTLMYFEEGVALSWLWKIGRWVLMLCTNVCVAGLLVASLLTAITALTAFLIEHLVGGAWKCLCYLPAVVWLGVVVYKGFDVYFETETGVLFGSLVAVLVVLGILGVVVIIAMRGKASACAARSPRGLYGGLALLLPLFAFLFTLCFRPYVPVVATMNRQVMEQDWKGTIETALKHKTLTYRQIAAFYAIALVHTNKQCTNLFDIRMDYDDPYLHGYNGMENNGSSYYMEECDFHSGLIETAIHHAMEQMTMNQPSIRTLKLLTKCALMRGEWKVAEKYLTILKRVPFENEFIEKYTPMVGNMDRVNADPEFAQIRLTEPVHDDLESHYVKPIFLGYFSDLYEGRSMNALWNSLAVNIYSKRMDAFLMRCQPLVGSMPPTNVADALVCISTKHPEVMQAFPNLEFNRQHFASFVQEVKPYIKERPKYAEELFQKYAGYYGYYYFFGNLKATRKSEPEKSSEKQGVN